MSAIDWTVELGKFGGFLRCETCMRTQGLGDISVAMSSGWPVCHGHTMHWWTQRQINAGLPAPVEQEAQRC